MKPQLEGFLTGDTRYILKIGMNSHFIIVLQISTEVETEYELPGNF